MGLGLRDVGRAVAAAGVLAGQKINAKEEEKKAEKLRLEKEAEEKRRFELGRKDTEVRNEALRMQNVMTKATMANQALVSAFTMSQGNPDVMGKAMTEHSGDNLVWQHNPALTDQGTDQIGFNIGTWKSDPTTGEPVLGEDGKRVFVPATDSFKEKIFANPKDFANHVAKTANPNTLLANFAREQSIEDTRNKMQFAEDLKRKTAEKSGVPELRGEQAKTEQSRRDKLAAETALLKAKRETPEKFRADTAADKPVDTVVGIDGKPVKLTSQAVNRFKNSAKALGARFTGITDAETVRMGQMLTMKLPDSKVTGQQDVRNVAQDVLDGKYDMDRAAQVVADSYGLSTPIAKELILEESEGLKTNKPSVLERIFG